MLIFQETGGKLQELEADLNAKEKSEVKLSMALKNLKDSAKAEEKKLKQMEKSLADVCKCLFGFIYTFLHFFSL